jgi:hypothetical protein
MKASAGLSASHCIALSSARALDSTRAN